eukprot:IDg5998t1
MNVDPDIPNLGILLKSVSMFGFHILISISPPFLDAGSLFLSQFSNVSASPHKLLGRLAPNIRSRALVQCSCTRRSATLLLSGE